MKGRMPRPRQVLRLTEAELAPALAASVDEALAFDTVDEAVAALGSRRTCQPPRGTDDPVPPQPASGLSRG